MATHGRGGRCAICLGSLRQARLVLPRLPRRRPRAHHGWVASGADLPITVLVADDDAEVRWALGQLVAGHDHLRLVSSVGDGRAAREAAARCRPAVAVVDVRMPGGGAEAVRGIREASQDTAIVVFTACDDSGTEREMRAAGACRLVVKGDRQTAIVAAILGAAGGTGGACAVS